MVWSRNQISIPSRAKVLHFQLLTIKLRRERERKQNQYWIDYLQVTSWKVEALLSFFPEKKTYVSRFIELSSFRILTFICILLYQIVTYFLKHIHTYTIYQSSFIIYGDLKISRGISIHCCPWTIFVVNSIPPSCPQLSVRVQANCYFGSMCS